MEKLSTTNAITSMLRDGDKLVLTERDGTRIHTVYLPHSFVPLLRFEGDKPPTITPLADKLEQEVGITLPPDFKQTLHHIEQALRTNRLSEEQHAWLNQVQLSPDYLDTLPDPLPDTPYAAQLYDCNHLGTPQQLINLNGDIDWSITLDAWGNTLSEENPHQLHQPIRMQGQQYDEESGLHYNRHRYYDPTIGRYITQDPIGLRGGVSMYSYVMNNPMQWIDPLGLDHTSGKWKDCGKGCRIRIDGDAVGDGRHLHWECKNGSGAMGEFGGVSHGEDYSSAPNAIKKCAKKYGFEPEPSKDLSCKSSGLSTTDAAIATGATIGAGYIVYRVIRFIPSLAPPLWWSIPVNAVTP